MQGEESVMRPSILIGIATAMFGLLGCGNSGGASSPAEASESEPSSGGEVAAPTSVVHATGGVTVTALLGPPGGSLELASGVKIEIPPGAVEGGQEYVLKEAPKTTAFGNQEREHAVGPTFIFAPEVSAPEGRTIRVSIPLASVPPGWGEPSIGFEYFDGEVVGGEDAEHTRWQYEDAKLSGGRAVAELPGLNGYRLQFVLTNLSAQ